MFFSSREELGHSLQFPFRQQAGNNMDRERERERRRREREVVLEEEEEREEKDKEEGKIHVYSFRNPEESPGVLQPRVSRISWILSRPGSCVSKAPQEISQAVPFLTCHVHKISFIFHQGFLSFIYSLSIPLIISPQKFMTVQLFKNFRKRQFYKLLSLNWAKDEVAEQLHTSTEHKAQITQNIVWEWHGLFTRRIALLQESWTSPN